MYDYDDQTVRDLYKDAHGSRPSLAWDANWRGLSPDQKQAVWTSLIRTMDERINLDDQLEAHALEVFEQHVASAIECGAGDRKTALRWMFTDEDPDLGYELFKMGIWTDRRMNPLLKEIREALGA